MRTRQKAYLLIGVEVVNVLDRHAGEFLGKVASDVRRQFLAGFESAVRFLLFLLLLFGDDGDSGINNAASRPDRQVVAGGFWQGEKRRWRLLVAMLLLAAKPVEQSLNEALFGGTCIWLRRVDLGKTGRCDGLELGEGALHS